MRLQEKIDEELKESMRIIDDILPTDFTESAYECIEIIDNLIETMVDMHEKEIPIPYNMYKDAVQLKYDMVVRIIESKQMPKKVITKED